MSPRALERLQRRVARSIVFAPDPELVAGVTGGGRLTPAEAVEVYRRQYPARLTEALGETYERCWRALGDEGFFAVCREFIARTPSLSHNLSDYGAGFAEFLDSRPGLRHAPFLGDLARLEWAFKELFHRAPHRGLSAAELAAATTPTSVLRFGDAMSILALSHRVYGIWKRDPSDDTPLEPRDWNGEQRLILYKNGGNEVYSRELGAGEHGALTALAAGRALSDALGDAEGLDEDGAAGLFRFIGEAGLVADVA